MIYTKIRDREFLCEYDLDISLFKRFDLNVYDVVPIRKAFIVCTDKGNKILKKIDYPIEELHFISKVLKYINQKFDRTIKFVKTHDNQIYSIWNDDVYCIMNLVKGRECEYSNPVDVEIVTQALAQFHRAGEGIIKKINYDNKNYAGKLINILKRKKEEMIFFKNIANWYESKSKFDLIFLDNVDYNLNEIDRSIDIIQKSDYFKLSNEEDNLVLCHHDLAHHNILINDSEAYFIDFDYSVIDLKIHDLCNFITKVVKRFDYDIEKANDILDIYTRYYTLNKDELEVLYGMFVFPEDFYSIARGYYTKRKNWSSEVFLSKLERKVNLQEPKQEFLDDFRENL
ncbi:CotS family spore coat protein [Haloimpatiens sp. FM7330]|uniref:CotS family spore coat protein n=1 Tax=Haloimpatiens sp. FM7330 TaxID=3298610 RepID=UPI00364548FE